MVGHEMANDELARTRTRESELMATVASLRNELTRSSEELSRLKEHERELISQILEMTKERESFSLVPRPSEIKLESTSSPIRLRLYERR